MRAWLLVVAVAAVVVGERTAGYHDLLLTATDVAAGATYLLVGILAWRTSRRHAAVAYAAGLAWFAGGLAAPALWVHRPLMLQAGLTFPTGRLGDRKTRVVVGAWWVAALVPALARNAWLSLALAAVAAAVGWRLAGIAPPGRRETARTAAASTTALAAALALGAVDRLLGPGGLGLPATAVYAGLVALAGALLVVGQLQPRREADVVIELTEDDPAETLAALRREAAARDDAGSQETVRAAIGMLETNRSLHADLEDSIAEVRASRRRLVEAGVVERRRLEQRLAGGAVSYLDELADVLTGLAAMEPADDLRGLALQSLDEVDRTREDLAQLGRGLHPRLLAERGLCEALTELARRSPVPTQVHAPDRRLPELVETTVWYACAEAVANMVKHSTATSARIDVRVDASYVRATVTDDGVGGARLTAAGGLAGLADRLSAVDGSLAIDSPPGAGTRLEIVVPAS